MSKILLEDAKRFLSVIHDDDDEKLQQLLDAAEDEALRFMDREFLPVVPLEQLSECESELDPVSESESPSEVSDEIVPSVRQAIYLLLKESYDLVADKAYRDRAETLLMPLRRHIGV